LEAAPGLALVYVVPAVGTPVKYTMPNADAMVVLFAGAVYWTLKPLSLVLVT
jgi:hypothetical protein